MNKNKDLNLPNVQKFLTPAKEAVEQIMLRRKNENLVKKVEDFLLNDIPSHFKGDEPIFYLSRHLATPNFETLRFIELTEPFKLPITIGQDVQDKFVSNNSLKHALGKLTIQKGTSKNGDPIFENHTLVDFNKNTGKQIDEVTLTSGKKLTTFHDELFRHASPTKIEIIDESQWVTRQHRGDMLLYYKKMLALLVVHGIMFEFYEEDDLDFVENILEPAFIEIEKIFEHKPLICELLTPQMEREKNWIAYPDSTEEIIKNELRSKL